MQTVRFISNLKAKESFSYKQLIFEPFMGGGIITAMAAIVIYEFGSMTALTISYAVMLFWIGVGLWLEGKKLNNNTTYPFTYQLLTSLMQKINCKFFLFLLK